MEVLVDILLWAVYILSLYIGVFWLINLLESRAELKRPLHRVSLRRNPFVTVIVPAYNEEKNVVATIDSIANLDYPADRFEILIVNDGSTDNTAKVAEEAIKKHAGFTIRLINQPNRGKAAALNKALQIAKGEFFACLDADSFVDRATLKKMLKVYEANDRKLTIVTPTMQVASPKTILQWMQKIEYVVSVFVVRLMSRIDTIYVAPGPFSLYRTSAIRKLGGFDGSTCTEDQEIGYRVQQHHLKIKQCPDSVVYTIAPKSLKGLYCQRRRWMRGSLMNIVKYKKMMFNSEYGDFGMFQVPLNLLTYFFSFSAIILFSYFLLWPLVQKLRDLFIIRFDFWPYLKDIFKYDFNLINFDVGKIFVLLTILACTLTLLYFAYKHSRETLSRARKFYIVPYLFVYYLVISSIAMKVLFDVIIRRKQKW